MELKTGSSESTLDDKGRVNIPVRFREQFQGDLFITRGQERCVWIITPPAWENLKKNLGNSEVFTPEERRFYKETMIDLKEDVKIDKAGRIAIPSLLRGYANLSSKCTVICSGDRLAVWDSDEFIALIKKREEPSTASLNKFGDRDIFSAV